MKKFLALILLGLITLSSCTTVAVISEEPNGELSEKDTVQIEQISQEDETLERPTVKTEPITGEHADQIRADRITDFAFDIFRQISEENAAFSPVSAMMALSMLATGAETETEAGFEFLFNMSTEDLLQICKTFKESLARIQGDTVAESADSVWLKEGVSLKETYRTEVETVFGAQILEDRILSSEAVMQEINAWISDNTHGLIPSMLTEPLPAETVMTLIDTLYMKAKWRTQFDPMATYDETFYLTDGTEKQTPFMHKTAQFDYMEHNGVTGIRLPYRDGRLAFVALMPDENTDLDAFLQTLNTETWKTVLGSAENRKVRLAMPKFTAETSVSLKKILSDMGLARAFTDGADFSAMSETPVKVGEILQKVKVIVDEEGTEAAAATMAIMMATAMRPVEEPIELTLNRPYLYAVIDTETDLPWFVGVTESPVVTEDNATPETEDGIRIGE